MFFNFIEPWEFINENYKFSKIPVRVNTFTLTPTPLLGRHPLTVLMDRLKIVL